jgi:hypothetical protein
MWTTRAGKSQRPRASRRCVLSLARFQLVPRRGAKQTQLSGTYAPLNCLQLLRRLGPDSSHAGFAASSGPFHPLRQKPSAAPVPPVPPPQPSCVQGPKISTSTCRSALRAYNVPDEVKRGRSEPSQLLLSNSLRRRMTHDVTAPLASSLPETRRQDSMCALLAGCPLCFVHHMKVLPYTRLRIAYITSVLSLPDRPSLLLSVRLSRPSRWEQGRASGIK